MVLSLEAHILHGMNISSEGRIINFLINGRCTRGLPSPPWRYHRTKNSHWSQDQPRGRTWGQGGEDSALLFSKSSTEHGRDSKICEEFVNLHSSSPAISPRGVTRKERPLHQWLEWRISSFHEELLAVCLRFVWVTNYAKCRSVEEGERDKVKICFSPSFAQFLCPPKPFIT